MTVFTVVILIIAIVINLAAGIAIAVENIDTIMHNRFCKKVEKEYLKKYGKTLDK